MTRLVEQLLDLSRTEPDAVLHPQVPVDVAGLVRSAVTDFSAQAEARQIDLGAQISTPADGAVLTLGNASQLRIMLNNLVDNALRYTPRQGRIDVSLAQEGAAPYVVLQVADSGPGIPQTERGAVFERFRRASTAEGPDGIVPGTGLGLSIVKAVADQHGATVLLTDGLPSPDGSPGLAVRITLRRCSG